MPIEVIKPGLATTVQDRGREGYYHVGVPPSGGLDQFSLVAANLLVGNEPGGRHARVRLPGAAAAVHRGMRVVAVTGAAVEVKVNGEARPGWTRPRLKAGDRLAFGHLQGGARDYIAVTGRLDVPEVLGSRSCTVSGHRRVQGPEARRPATSWAIGAPA